MIGLTILEIERALSDYQRRRCKMEEELEKLKIREAALMHEWHSRQPPSLQAEVFTLTPAHSTQAGAHTPTPRSSCNPLQAIP